MAGMLSGLAAFCEFVGGGDRLGRASGKLWLYGGFCIFAAAFFVAGAKRPGFFMLPHHVLPFIRAIIAGCPRWVAILSGVSAAVFSFLAATLDDYRADLSDGIAAAELPVVVAVPLVFSAASAPVLWSISARARWAAAF